MPRPRGVDDEHGRGLCEHAFVTSQGGAYSQFKRALARGNFIVAWGLARDLPQLALADRLELLLLARNQEPVRFDRAVPRSHARLCTELRLTSAEAQLALAALAAFPGPGGFSGAQALAARVRLDVLHLESLRTATPGGHRPRLTPAEAARLAKVSRKTIYGTLQPANASAAGRANTSALRPRTLRATILSLRVGSISAGLLSVASSCTTSIPRPHWGY